MSNRSFGRRDFLCRAALAAGSLGATGMTMSVIGCGNDATQPQEATIPPPSDLTATAVSPARIHLSWTDNSNNESGFEVERKDGAEGSFALLTTLPQGAQMFEDSTVAENTAYVYRVRAVADDRSSDYSNEASTRTPASGSPIAPTSLTVAGVTSTSVDLSWLDNSSNEEGFRIEIVDGASTVPVPVAPGKTRFEITGLSPDRLYRFTLFAHNSAGDSAPSNSVAARTGVAAADLIARVGGPGSLSLFWSDRTGGSSGFSVERKVGTGDFATIGMVNPGAPTSFADTDMVPGAELTYRVVAAAEIAIPGNEVRVNVPDQAPAAPGDLSVGLSPNDGSHTVLTWQHDGLGDLGGFQVERKSGAGAFTQVHAGADPGQRSHEDAPSSPLISHTYRVRAFNLAGLSGFSNEASRVTRAAFFFSGGLSALNTVGSGARATLAGLSPRNFGSSCSSSNTNLWLVRDAQAHVQALVAHCTHACCTGNSFNFNSTAALFTCSCHGSQFRVSGEVARSPAVQPLRVLQTEFFADRVEIIPPSSPA